MRWNGSTWQETTTPDPSKRYDDLEGVVALSPTDAWAVGYTLPRDLDIQPLFLHWDGSTWGVVSTPHLPSTYNYLQSIAAVSKDEVWAAGYRTVNDHQVVSLVERWDGARWRVDASPNLADGGNYLYGLAVDPGGGLWSAGYFYPHDFSGFRTLILHRSPS